MPPCRALSPLSITSLSSRSSLLEPQMHVSPDEAVLYVTALYSVVYPVGTTSYARCYGIHALFALDLFVIALSSSFND